MKYELSTIDYYERNAERFWAGTRAHDVTQNYDAFLKSMTGDGPYKILDFGCGPGRDVASFQKLGHEPIGLDGTLKFVTMAADHTGCSVLHQDFTKLDLPSSAFDGVFANASLFHVPKDLITKVLLDIFETLTVGGILFSSNPIGTGKEIFSDGRYGVYYSEDEWIKIVKSSGFCLVNQYFRPKGLPRKNQNWFATVWKKLD